MTGTSQENYTRYATKIVREERGERARSSQPSKGN